MGFNGPRIKKRFFSDSPLNYLNVAFLWLPQNNDLNNRSNVLFEGKLGCRRKTFYDCWTESGFMEQFTESRYEKNRMGKWLSQTPLQFWWARLIIEGWITVADKDILSSIQSSETFISIIETKEKTFQIQTRVPFRSIIIAGNKRSRKVFN